MLIRTKYYNLIISEKIYKNFLNEKVIKLTRIFGHLLCPYTTFSGVFTHYSSFIDDSYKKSLISTLLFRCFSLCSSLEKFHQEIEFLRDVFKRNGYPSSLIETSIKVFFEKFYVPKRVVLTVPKKELLVILPFMGNISITLRKQLHSCVTKLLPPCKTKLIFKSTNRLSSVFSFKDTIPNDLRSHLIYKFTCGNCNVSYYGKTTSF